MDSDRIVGSAKKVGGKLEDAAGRVVGDDGLRVEGMVDEASGAVQAAYGQAKDAVRDYADKATDVAGDAYDRGRRYVGERFDSLPDEAERYYRSGRQAAVKQVEESPLLAMLVAGAVGYMLAVLVHRR